MKCVCQRSVVVVRFMSLLLVCTWVSGDFERPSEVWEGEQIGSQVGFADDAVVGEEWEEPPMQKGLKAENANLLVRMVVSVEPSSESTLSFFTLRVR